MGDQEIKFVLREDKRIDILVGDKDVVWGADTLAEAIEYFDNNLPSLEEE